MTLSNNLRAYEYLLYGITSARSDNELERMRQLARAHYSGTLLAELEATIDTKARALSGAMEAARPSS